MGARGATMADKQGRIWDAATAKEIAILGHESPVMFAMFSVDGSRLLTSSRDNTVRIWDTRLQTMSSQELLAEACARLRGIKKLTRDEMRLAGYPDSMLEIDVCQ
jgi:WD40 repeat protein